MPFLELIEFFLNGQNFHMFQWIQRITEAWIRVKFKDLVSNMCLAGSVVAWWCLTQKMASLSPFTVMTYISVSEFVNSVKHLGKPSINISVLERIVHGPKMFYQGNCTYLMFCEGEVPRVLLNLLQSWGFQSVSAGQRGNPRGHHPQMNVVHSLVR